jgi:hypothetical protein
MNWFEQRKKAERREAIVFVLNIVFWLVLGLGLIRLVGGPW